MAKRGKTVKKTVTVTEISTKKSKKVPKGNDDSKDKTSKLLLENFIALQEALTNIGYETKELNKKVTAMLDLFETAAKNFQEHPESRSLSSKIDDLVEQNKIIAKSLLLMHKTTKEKLDESDSSKSSSKEHKGFKQSITDEPEEDEKDAKNKKKSDEEDEEVTVEKDDASESDSSEEFKPEPLPEFNF